MYPFVYTPLKIYVKFPSTIFVKGKGKSCIVEKEEMVKEGDRRWKSKRVYHFWIYGGLLIHQKNISK
ncbi:hypothetical protein CN568_12300 [Bacillus pseudomycoides]|nr:hypothetical protein BLX05_17000 [Bacillus pseudomycoides]PDY14579.1 hypothetical protein COO16_01940 [Bacillus pseudomycoides]PEF75850.1 hypothetical protein CON94_07975 [Bacillus pseudomycoides]PEI52035.1 hypothetical protein CN641_00770 [Bacillus pseudomycoides]PEJ32064.1 hypothetical protein CN677_17660 [Bacillus pseudomycoides]